MRIKSLLKPVVSLAVTMSVVLSMGVAIFAREAEGTPNTSFDVGDTITAGTVIYDSYTYSDVFIYPSQEEYDQGGYDYTQVYLRGSGTWEADKAYLVVDVDYDYSYRHGFYYDLYVVPLSSDSGESSLTAEQLRQLSVNIFVETLYERILGRTYDVTGRDYWVDQLNNHGATGADVVRGILRSAEFNPGDLTEEELVLALYSDLYNRIPSAGETANWTGAIKDGATRQAVLDYFLSSPEWEAICAYYCVNF
ncbi:MAG: DUF4214 domain-containing protein [Clostridiales bacterium]|nr:DUF4214 domain-containing protein [Clostridiales bacterium]